jgi:hypothetical protein
MAIFEITVVDQRVLRLVYCGDWASPSCKMEDGASGLGVGRVRSSLLLSGHATSKSTVSAEKSAPIFYLSNCLLPSARFPLAAMKRKLKQNRFFRFG